MSDSPSVCLSGSNLQAVSQQSVSSQSAVKQLVIIPLGSQKYFVLFNIDIDYVASRLDVVGPLKNGKVLYRS